MPPAFPGLEMCGSTATSTTSVPTPAAPPAPVADALTAAPFYSPSARRRKSIASSAARSTTKSSCSSNRGNSSNNQKQQEQQPQQAQQHQRAPRGIEPETFWIWGGLGGFACRGACACALGVGCGDVFRRSKNPSRRHSQLQLGLYKQKHTTDKPSITKPDCTRHAGEAGGFKHTLYIYKLNMWDVYTHIYYVCWFLVFRLNCSGLCEAIGPEVNCDCKCRIWHGEIHRRRPRYRLHWRQTLWRRRQDWYESSVRSKRWGVFFWCGWRITFVYKQHVGGVWGLKVLIFQLHFVRHPMGCVVISPSPVPVWKYRHCCCHCHRLVGNLRVEFGSLDKHILPTEVLIFGKHPMNHKTLSVKPCDACFG